MSDILEWFTSHIEELQAMLPPGENAGDSSRRAALILLDSLKRKCQWGDMANTLAQFKTQIDKIALESEAKRRTDLLMVASAKAQKIFAELTSSDSQIEIRSTEDVREATEATAVMMQHAMRAYKTYKALAGGYRSERNLWGIGAGTCALATYLFASSPIRSILPGLGAVACAVKAGLLWEEYRKWQKVSRAISDARAVSHHIWGFLIVHLMRLHGLPTNKVAFDDIAVAGDTEDVQIWMKKRTGYMQKRLEDVHTHTSK